MDNVTTLSLFPIGSLSSSVITTIWIGVWVVTFFNLRFGWVKSGLVVPGYLVPLILVKPWAALVIVIEAMVSYTVIWLYSEKFLKLVRHTNFFGRDRFFALLLVSVLVRILFDGFFWPYLGELINSTWNLNFDYRNNLHSFGLVIVALIANQLWKPGLRNGLVVLVTTVGITFLIVRYGFMKYTNFNVGNLTYMYENLASSMLAGPKAYIILLTTAYIASHLNLRYGWEYSGIMIPALLALEWYQPIKLFVTFLETFLVLVLGSQLLRLPFFQRTTIEGARKILFFFNISFVYKILLGHFIIAYFPLYKITDYYGFGYLLTTLLASKMHDKDIAARITRATLQTSLYALIIATIIGFSLSYVPNLVPLWSQSSQTFDITPVHYVKKSLPLRIKEEQVSFYKSIRKNSVPSPLAEKKDIFHEALRTLHKTLQIKSKHMDLEAAQVLFNRVNYSLSVFDDRYIVLSESKPQKGWGIYIINLKAENDLQIQVPAPVSEWNTALSGLALLNQLEAKSLSISGCYRMANDNGTADVITTANTFFHTFQSVFGTKGVVQVRGLTGKNRKVLDRQLDNKTKLLLDQGKSLFMVENAIPHGCNLTLLESLLDDFQISWQTSISKNVLRESSLKGFTELFLSKADRQSLLFKPFFDKDLFTFESSAHGLRGYLQEWLLNRKGTIAEKGSDLYVAPSLEELLFIDHELFTPLVKLIDNIRAAFPAISKRVNDHDRKIIESSIYAVELENKGLSAKIADQFGIQLKIPGKFQESLDIPEEDFLWIRKDEKGATLSFLFKKIEYNKTDQLNLENLIKLRNDLGKYISTDSPNSKMVVNNEDLPVYEYNIKIDDHYTKELRGIWEISNDYLGGAFASYAIVRDVDRSITFVDAFVYAPGKEKRDFMQKLDHIVKNAKIVPPTAEQSLD